MSFNSLIKKIKDEDNKTILDSFEKKDFALKPPKIDQSKGDNTDQLVDRAQRKFNIEFDRYFLTWIKDIKHGIFLTSYKTGEVISLGIMNEPGNEGKLSMWLTNFVRPMGMYSDNENIWLLSSGNLSKYDNVGKSVDSEFGDFDATFIPRFSYFGSDIDSHDICLDREGNPYYCSATFSCICVPSKNNGFKVWWKPPWISKIASEDRCHLNGLCSRDGMPRYVTCVAQTDVIHAWRENRIGKGIVYDIMENRVVCTGLTMPHSPRWHNGKLWVLDAGTGWVGEVDLENSKFIRRTWIPGFLRGVCFIRDEFMIVGTSDDRYEKCFSDLPLGDEMKKKEVSPKCGLTIIEMKTMNQVHYITFGEAINEIYDVCSAPNMTRPKIRAFGEMSSLREHFIDYGEYSDFK